MAGKKKSNKSKKKSIKKVKRECPICGEPVRSNWAVCSNCGAKNLEKDKKPKKEEKKLEEAEEKLEDMEKKLERGEITMDEFFKAKGKFFEKQGESFEKFSEEEDEEREDMNEAMKAFKQVQDAKIKRMQKEYDEKKKSAEFIKSQTKSSLDEEIKESEKKWKEEHPEGLTPEQRKKAEEFKEEMRKNVELRKKKSEESLAAQEELSKKVLELQDVKVSAMKERMEIAFKLDKGEITQDEAQTELEKVNSKVNKLKAEVEEAEKINAEKAEEVKKAIAISIPIPGQPIQKFSKPENQISGLSEKCPGCGGGVKPQWITCPECYYPLKEKRKRICPGCGDPLKVKDRTCGSCGRFLEENDGYSREKEKKKPRRCPHCGEDMKPNWPSCVNCGKFVGRDEGYDYKEEKKKAEEEKKFEEKKEEEIKEDVNQLLASLKPKIMAYNQLRTKKEGREWALKDAKLKIDSPSFAAMDREQKEMWRKDRDERIPSQIKDLKRKMASLKVEIDKLVKKIREHEGREHFSVEGLDSEKDKSKPKEEEPLKEPKPKELKLPGTEIENEIFTRIINIVDDLVEDYEKLNEKGVVEKYLEEGNVKGVLDVLDKRYHAVSAISLLLNTAVLYHDKGRNDMFNSLLKALSKHSSLVKISGDKLTIVEYPTEKLIGSKIKESEEKKDVEISDDRAKLYKSLGAKKLPEFLKRLKKGRENAKSDEEKKEFDVYISEVSEILSRLK